MSSVETFKSKLLPTLRGQQLLDLARAYKLHVPKDGMTLLQTMQTYEEQGVFKRPPRNLYYFVRAKYADVLE